MARKIYDLNDDENSSSNEEGVVDLQLQTQSRELYANFVREEIQLQGLAIPQDVSSYVFLKHCTEYCVSYFSSL